MSTHFDHIILGTGQATGTLLGGLIPTGESIAVIEKDKVGGSCVNYGCTPTKALVASARAIHQARQGDEFGFSCGDIRIDYSRIRERMNEIRNNSRKGLTEWIQDTENATLFRGTGRFVSENSIQVGEDVLSGGNIYINTGTRPAFPPIDGLDAVEAMDSAALLDLDTLPGHLLIIGGGYVGLELAQVYRRFGSEVTVIQRNERIMPREDEDTTEAIQEFLSGEGIRILCGAETQKVMETETGSIQLEFRQKDKVQQVEGSHLLVAAGRVPNSDTINPEAAGLQISDKGFIQVDEYGHTGTGNIYALGDVNGEGAFTHTSVNDAEVVLDHLNGGNRKISDRNTIYSLFTDPPLGRVGLTEKEALDQGYHVLKATKPMAKISRAKEMSETTGFAKLLVDGETDMILGASILGPGADEIINMFASIMHSGIPCREFRNVVLVHPTVSELMPFMLDGIKEAREQG